MWKACLLCVHARDCRAQLLVHRHRHRHTHTQRHGLNEAQADVEQALHGDDLRYDQARVPDLQERESGSMRVSACARRRRRRCPPGRALVRSRLSRRTCSSCTDSGAAALSATHRDAGGQAREVAHAAMPAPGSCWPPARAPPPRSPPLAAACSAGCRAPQQRGGERVWTGLDRQQPWNSGQQVLD